MTPPRPILLPGLPRVWHGPHTLQLGLTPPRAVLLDLRDPAAARVLDLLDGTRTESGLLSQARDQGIPPDQAQALLGTLQSAGLVLPAHHLHPESMPQRLSAEAAALAYARPDDPPARVLRRRAEARIAVTGRGRLAPGIAVALAESGIGHVQPDLPGPVTPADLPGGPLPPATLGLPRAQATAAAIQQAAPSTKTHPIRRGAASLVIQLNYDQPVALLAAAHARRRQPYLAVTIREAKPVIGPLVRPATPPCLNCIARHRQDRGTQLNPPSDWPLTPPARPVQPLSPGEDRPPGPGFPPGHPSLTARPTGLVEPCAAVTLLAATAFAVGEALVFLDGGTPETLGAEVEISAPGRVRRRSWPAHPDCDCGRPRPRTKRT